MSKLHPYFPGIFGLVLYSVFVSFPPLHFLNFALSYHHSTYCTSRSTSVVAPPPKVWSTPLIVFLAVSVVICSLSSYPTFRLV
jgi:hypothetical protein